jgi:hypothetical protein
MITEYLNLSNLIGKVKINKEIGQKMGLLGLANVVQRG